MITPELSEALQRATTYDGAGRVAALEDAVLIADRSEEVDGILLARLTLAQARQRVPDAPTDLALLGWLLAQLDTDVPDDGQRLSILWLGKWAMERVINIPEVSVPAAEALMDDVGRRIVSEGYSERPMAQQRGALASMAGTDEEIDHWLARWRSAPRDTMADCSACEEGLLGEIEFERGDEEAALVAWQALIAGQGGCAEQPQRILGQAAHALIRRGHLQDALSAHRTGWRLGRFDPVNAVPMVRQLMVLVRSGYVGAAVTRLLQRLSWLEELSLASERMYFSGIAATVLRAGQEIGCTPTTIADQPTEQLIERLRADAEDLARRFDDRNGTPAMSRRLAAWTDPAPFQTPLSIPNLTPDRAASSPTAVIDPVELTVRMKAEIDRGADVADLVEAWLAARSRVGTADRSVSVGEQQARAYLDRQLAQRLAREDSARAAALLRTARDAADLADDDHERVLIDIAELALHDEPDPQRIDDARRKVDGWVDSGEAEVAARVLLALVRYADSSDQSAEMTRASELFEQAGDRLWSLTTQISATMIALPEGADPIKADERLREIQRSAAGDDLAFAEVQALSARAVIAGATGTSGELDLYREAALRAESASVRFPCENRFGYASALANSGEWQQVRQVADELIRQATREYEPLLRAQGEWLAALAEQQLGNPTEAADLFELALPGLRRAGGRNLAQALWQLGQCLAELNEVGAERTLVEAAEVADQVGDQQIFSYALHQAAQEAARGGNATAAGQRCAVVMERAAHYADLSLYIRAGRLRADVIGQQSSSDEGAAALTALRGRVTELAEQHGVSADLDEPVFHAQLELQCCDLFAGEERWPETFACLDRAEQLIADRFEVFLQVRAVRAEYLIEVDRLAEAKAILEEILPHLAPEQRQRPVQLLCRALVHADREQEADAFWEAHLGSDPS